MRSPFRSYVPRVALEGEARRWTTSGSLLFADVSGFTALCERLSRLGRLGAEELTDVIDGVFTGLIDVVLEHDGDVVSFGGDAMLVWFDASSSDASTPAPDLAVECAHRMQAWLEQHAARSTSVGDVALSMSVGVAAGPVEFVLAGRRSTELLVLGPTVDLVLRSESAADSGQVVVGATAVDSGDDHLVVAERSQPSVPRKATELILISERSAGREETFVPPTLRREIEGADTRSEHRSGSIGFVRAQLVTGGRTADELYELVEQIADRNGVDVIGTDVDVGGFKIILSSGAPRSAVRRRERVVATAFEIAASLGLAVGVGHGIVFAGDVGHVQRRTWTVMGDAVNVAARLAAAASSGTAFVPADVADEVGDRFEFDPVVTLQLKGKAEGLPVRRVTATADRPPVPSAELPLLGREQAIHAVLDQPGSVDVVAAPGAGRTRLLAEAMTRSQGGLWCAGSPTNQRRGWSTIAPVIAWVLADDLDVPERVLLARLLARSADSSEPADERTADGPVEARVVLALAEPLRRNWRTIFVDDVHWGDDHSVDVLAGLAASGVRLVTSRSATSDVPGWTHHSLELGPIDDASVEMIAVAASSDPLSDHALAEIVSLAGGVPQHAVALAMHRGDDLPSSIEELRSTAFDKLTPRDRYRLRVAAVVGLHIDTELLAHVTDDPAWSDREQLRALGAFLIEGPSGWQFRRESDRQAAYVGMPVATRRRLHVDIAAHLASAGEDAGVVAGHAIDGRSDDLVARFAPVAARNAARRAAWHEAHHFASNAAQIRSGMSVEEQVTLWIQAADAAEHAGLPDAADVALRSAVSVALSPVTAASIWARRAVIARRSGRLPLSLRWCSLGLRAIETAAFSPESASEVAAKAASVELHLERAATLVFQGRLDEAAISTDTAEEFARSTGRRADFAQVLVLREMLYSAHGEIDAADAVAEQALPMLLAEGDVVGAATVLVNRGAERGESGDWVAAVELLRRSRDLFGQAGHVVGEMVASSNLFGVLADQGHRDSAAAGFERIRRISRAAHRPDLDAFATATIGRLAAWDERHDDAQALLTEALSRPADQGDPALSVWSLLFAAEAAALRDEPVEVSTMLALVDRETLASMPAATLAYQRLEVAARAEPIERLDACFDEAVRSEVGLEIVLAVRWLEALGSATSEQLVIAHERSAALGIVNPPPVPAALLSAAVELRPHRKDPA